MHIVIGSDHAGYRLKEHLKHVMKADGQIIYAATDLRVGLFEGGEQPAAA